MNAATMAKATRIALAFVFLAAAPQKIAAPADFAASIASYLILPDVLNNFTALVLPWLEIVVAFMLLCLVWTGMALFLANAMLVAFLAAIVSAYLRGIDISCGCFSTSAAASDDMIWYMARDGIFLAVGLIAAWLHRGGRHND